MYECRVFSERELVVLTMIGDVTADDVIEGFHELISDPGYRPEYVGVADLRDARVHADEDETERIANYVVAQGSAGRGRWAYLVNRPESTALTQYYAGVVAERHPTRIFSTVEGASEYLGVRLDDLLTESP